MTELRISQLVAAELRRQDKHQEAAEVEREAQRVEAARVFDNIIHAPGYQPVTESEKMQQHRRSMEMQVRASVANAMSNRQAIQNRNLEQIKANEKEREELEARAYAIIKQRELAHAKKRQQLIMVAKVAAGVALAAGAIITLATMDFNAQTTKIEATK